MLRSCCQIVSSDQCQRKRGADQVFDPLEQLGKQLPCLILAQLLLHDNVVEKLALRRELEHQVYAVALAERILQTQHVGVAHTHEHTNLLLQTFRLRLILHAWVFCENLDGISLAGCLLHTEVHLCKVTLAKFLQESVLLEESTGLPAVRISENKACLAMDGNLIAVLQFAPLVATYECLVDKCSVLGQILYDGGRIGTLIFSEDEAVTIRDDMVVDNNVCIALEFSSQTTHWHTYRTPDDGRSDNHPKGCLQSWSAHMPPHPWTWMPCPSDPRASC